MIDFDGVVNCRDVGGLALETGGVTRHGVLFRSETPQFMSETDVKRAREQFGIGLVIDLRGKKFQGTDLGGSGPLASEGRGVNIDFMGLAGGMDVVDQTPEGFLIALLDCGAKGLEVFLEHFVSTDQGVLVHCHTGKDRTGFVIAMTLAMAGVRDEDIIADYAMSGPVFDMMMAKLAANGMPVPPGAPAYAHHPPSVESITQMFRLLRTRWTSPHEWALQQGIKPDLIASARARLVA
ncbi:MAG: tyrosine-protein phosphatase [Rhizobiaceae bacterium]|nr:tyrosine-protein phosphatase [Rhizobiaceae bacterium]